MTVIRVRMSSNPFQAVIQHVKERHDADKWRAADWERAKSCAHVLLQHLMATPSAWRPTHRSWRLPDMSRHLDLTCLLGREWEEMSEGTRRAVLDCLEEATPHAPWLRVVFYTLDSMDLELIMTRVQDNVHSQSSHC